MKHRNAGRPVAIRRLFIRKGNEHGICVAVRLPIPPYLPIRKGPALQPRLKEVNTMRNRTEEINVRVFKTEKNLIRRKARKCGMNMSEYLRTLGTDTVVREAPKEELMQAYRKLTRLHDGLRYEVSMAAFSDALTEIEDLLLVVYHGKEDDTDGGDEDLGNP